MNRIVVFGFAMFLAIVGIALLGGENSAVAGHGCNGCSCDGGCDGGCDSSCGGCHGGLLSRLHKRCGGCHGCGGGLLSRLRSRCCKPTCCEPAPCCGCDGGEAAEVEVDEVPEAPAEGDAADASFDRAPVAFRKVSFRR